MRRFAWLTLTLALATLALVPVSSSLAQTTCSCPWEVRQLDTSGGNDCTFNHNTGRQNAAFWAENWCVSEGRGHLCTVSYTAWSCTTNPDGSVTANGLVNYKCTSC
jgi:hypothetical protein